jgi:hypothetical protein
VGVDAEIFIAGTVTDEELAAAELYLMDRVEYLIGNGREHGYKLVGPRYDLDEPTIHLAVNQRYYGHGYERGSWPHLYGGIRAMQAAFPGRTVYYGGDSGGYTEECTPEFLEDLWQLFARPDHNNYIGAWNAFRPRQSQCRICGEDIVGDTDDELALRIELHASAFH